VPSVAPRDPESWQFAWPNTAHHNFNYYKLLDRAEQRSIAQKPAVAPSTIKINGVPERIALREIGDIRDPSVLLAR
jgi:hypothetical protein